MIDYDGMTLREHLDELRKRLMFSVIFLAIAVVVIVQFLLKLATGEVHERLRTLGGALGTYVHQIIAFLTYHSEDMPYPFGDWPDAESPDKKPVRRKGPAQKIGRAHV